MFSFIDSAGGNDLKALSSGSMRKICYEGVFSSPFYKHSFGLLGIPEREMKVAREEAALWMRGDIVFPEHRGRLLLRSRMVIIVRE